MPRVNLAELPLFATDAELGAALMGEKRVGEWKAIAPLLEAKGLPKVDQLHGGRFTPAVEAFYLRMYGLNAPASVAMDGPENPTIWQTRKRRA